VECLYRSVSQCITGESRNLLKRMMASMERRVNARAYICKVEL